MGRLAYRRSVGLLTLSWMLAGWGVAWSSVEAVKAIPPDLLSWPWLQILVGVLVSAWGGAAATLTRYLAAAYEGKPFHVKAEVAKDIVVSIVVGAATYLTGWLYSWSSMLVGLSLLLAGWLGVRVLSVAADRFLLAVSSKEIPK